MVCGVRACVRMDVMFTLAPSPTMDGYRPCIREASELAAPIMLLGWLLLPEIEAEEREKTSRERERSSSLSAAVTS